MSKPWAKQTLSAADKAPIDVARAYIAAGISVQDV